MLRGTLHRQEETAFMRLGSVRITLKKGVHVERHHMRRLLHGTAALALAPANSINPGEHYL
ncbi:hypothetical protein QF037_008747 [Streptomyces canus]|nr:hypothetical protein [Streptomyces canus]